ncbi:MAG TPA: hypothetical protein VEK33_22165, partial [Terriglobales bacterium]|nr:hypothetical protein [Terriglobales bacterium]
WMCQAAKSAAPYPFAATAHLRAQGQSKVRVALSIPKEAMRQKKWENGCRVLVSDPKHLEFSPHRPLTAGLQRS